MRTLGISCRRRGTSTIIGVIMFIGIIFTAFLPMLVYMRQADTLHELRKHELNIIDEERVNENIIYYTLPLTDPPRLSFIVENRGERLVKIERIWLNNESHVIDESVPSMTILSDLDPVNVADVEESYIIKLTTDRGNIFMPSSGVPTYNPISGEWQMDSFTIFIMMTEQLPQIHILVNYTHDGEAPVEPPETYYDSDVPKQSGYSISVPLAGQYYVNVTQWHGTPSQETLGTGYVTLGLTTPTALIII